MEIFDISVSVGDTVPVWDGDSRPTLTEDKTIDPRGTIQTTMLNMNVHTGTHIDAPRHFYPSGRIASEIDFNKLIGKCTVVQVSDGKETISKKDLITAGLVKSCKKVLLQTINSGLWELHRESFFHGYTALDKTAAHYLIELGVDLVGIDYLSIAPFDNVWDVHQELLSHEVVILEGINLMGIAPGEYELICLPLKLDSNDGLPVRAILRK